MLLFQVAVYALVQLAVGLVPTPLGHRPSYGVIPRADDTTWWDNAVSKGCLLYGAMFASDKEAGALFKPSRSSAQSEFYGTGRFSNQPVSAQPPGLLKSGV